MPGVEELTESCSNTSVGSTNGVASAADSLLLTESHWSRSSAMLTLM